MTNWIWAALTGNLLAPFGLSHSSVSQAKPLIRRKRAGNDRHSSWRYCGVLG